MAKIRELTGDTLRAQGDLAKSYCAIGEGNVYRWSFGGVTGLMYATDRYTMFFNASEVAITGDIGPTPGANWRRQFMMLANHTRNESQPLGPLFEILDQLPLTNGDPFAADKLLMDYYTSLSHGANPELKENP